MFAKATYTELVNQFQAAGLSFSTNWDEAPSATLLLMRHDVDFSIPRAHEMAAQEASLGVAATYFFMLTSNMYNLLSAESRRLAHEIKEMGHKISLHFDPTVYDSLEPFAEERQIFETAFGVKLDMVSIHRPGSFLENNNADLLGIKQTYQDRYFKDMKYLSDSGGRDIMPTIKEYLSDPNRQGLHLLIHPIWWGSVSENPTETLDRWKKEHTVFLTSEMRLNCKTYQG